jgi:hypothetical protein
MKKLLFLSSILLGTIIGCNTGNNTNEKEASNNDLITKENIHTTILGKLQTDTFFRNKYDDKLAFLNMLFMYDFSTKDHSYNAYAEYYERWFEKNMGAIDKKTITEIKADSIKQIRIQIDILKYCEENKITYSELFKEVERGISCNTIDSSALPILFNISKIKGICLGENIEKTLDSLNKELDKALNKL